MEDSGWPWHESAVGRAAGVGGKRVFAKTTFVLESLTSLGPQSCGDIRGRRTFSGSSSQSGIDVQASGVYVLSNNNNLVISSRSLIR